MDEEKKNHVIKAIRKIVRFGVKIYFFHPEKGDANFRRFTCKAQAWDEENDMEQEQYSLLSSLGRGFPSH